MSKPTIVGVPGAWHSPEVYDGVFERLKDQGYATLGVTLPSVGAVPAHQNFDADLDTIRKELVRLVEEEGKEVVLVTHSYSCLLCSHAPEGLGLKERTAKGLKGGVMRLVYIQGFAVPEGFNAMELSSEVPDWIQMDFEKGINTLTVDDAKRIMYSDLPDEEASKWAAKLQHQSIGVFGSTTAHAAWRYIPSTYVVAKQDKSMISKEYAHMMINAAKEIEPTAFDVVEEHDGGHCIMLSQPEWLAGVLRRAAGESV